MNPLTDLDVSRALVVGDMHVKLNAWRRIEHLVAQTRPDIVVQVGDFGFGWDDGSYLNEVDVIAERWTGGVPIVWLDGNHENFDLLETIGAFGADEPTQTSDKTWYIPRGYAWEWRGRRCMAVGGAYSVDKKYRTAHESWWEQETLTPADVERGCEVGECDLVFTHDSIAGYKVPGPHAEWKQAGEFDRLSLPSRLLLLDIVANAKPELQVHGHMHYGYTQPIRAKGHELEVVGLSLEGAQHSAITVDFPSLEWAWA